MKSSRHSPLWKASRQDETALDALKPSLVSLEWPPGEKVPELDTIVNQEHSLIMTDEVHRLTKASPP